MSTICSLSRALGGGYCSPLDGQATTCIVLDRWMANNPLAPQSHSAIFRGAVPDPWRKMASPVNPGGECAAMHLQRGVPMRFQGRAEWVLTQCTAFREDPILGEFKG